MELQTSLIRNVAIVGHGSEGKTTLAEAMLFNAGVIDRMGRVEDGNTVSDYDPEETRRQISIGAAVAPFEWKNHFINVMDVPGYFDFVGEMAAALRVADAAVILANPVSGVAVGAEKAWDLAGKNHCARLFFINNMDREHVDFRKVLSELQDKFGPSVAPVQMPILQGGKFTGYVDLIGMKAYAFDGKSVREQDVPEDMQGDAQVLREQLAEAAAGTDDELMEKYFEDGDLSGKDLIRGLRLGLADESVVPVLCGAAAPNLGITALMDCIADFVPSPADHGEAAGINPKNDEEVSRKCDASEPFSALVFKTVADPFVGKLSLFKVYSGTLRADSPVHNANIGKNEKTNAIYRMVGKKQVQVQELVAGDIGAMAKLAVTLTGHTLCDPAGPIVYPAIDFPAPSISMAVFAAKQGEEDKVFGGLARLAEEDPSFTVGKSDTGETLISGQGEMHIDIINAKLKNKFGGSAVLKDPTIPYKETIRKSVKAQGRHKKQSGGHGQFGDVWIEFEPIMGSDAEFEFVDKVVGGAVPRNFIPAVEKGLRESITKGVLAGFPVVNLRCTLYDGSSHSVDSSEMAFKVAANLAFKKGLTDANPVLLEPIQRIEVLIPEDYMGDIIADLNKRRGRIMGMEPQGGGLQKVIAEAPLAELFKYATDLRSMTQARGSFAMNFERYEEVPGNIAAKIVEKAKQEAQDE
ncbi:MAG: elongation factor G [Christensenellales bacterium]|jgi:elongation factor G